MISAMSFPLWLNLLLFAMLAAAIQPVDWPATALVGTCLFTIVEAEKALTRRLLRNT